MMQEKGGEVLLCTLTWLLYNGGINMERPKGVNCRRVPGVHCVHYIREKDFTARFTKGAT